MSSSFRKVEVAPGISLSEPLAAYWPAISASRRPYVKILATPSFDVRPGQSSFGAPPLLPRDYPYPTDAFGAYMYPLAQINFAEAPHLEPFPRSGYLQFYIAADDDVYGLDFDNGWNQKGFKVLFFEENEVRDSRTDFSFLSDILASRTVPINQPHRLSFQTADAYMGASEVAFHKNYSFSGEIKKKYPDQADDFWDEISETFPDNGHRLGGYAHFTQTDPRDYGADLKHLMLLFQMDSDEEIMLGDMGVANFFIDPAALAAKDFSRVYYNWDCC